MPVKTTRISTFTLDNMTITLLVVLESCVAIHRTVSASFSAVSRSIIFVQTWIDQQFVAGVSTFSDKGSQPS